ncbi:MAG: FluC/FEX family fluoride channel [Odoribacter splanchnicus]
MRGRRIYRCLRYLVGKLAHYFFFSFSWGTLQILSVVLSSEYSSVWLKSSPDFYMNVFLITGFCGGFTTFSSFADDMFL